MKCQICSSPRMHRVLSLGSHPAADRFISPRKLNEPEPRFPLDVFFCSDCKLVQLGEAADPRLLFTDTFVYTTGSSGELVKNFRELVEKLVKRFQPGPSDLAIDIGSNDGTLLANFLPHGVRVLGIDPSEAARLAGEKNVPTLPEFFNEETAQKIRTQYGKARIITATNVFAHVRELDSFVKGVKELLDERGVFVEESHYLGSMIEHMEFDSIYAEHLRYYSLKPLTVLFERFGMQVFDAEKISTHGGSLRVYACKSGAFPVSENISRILEEEKAAGLHEQKTFTAFADRVKQNRDELVRMLTEIRSKNLRIAGLGAPAKGNTLLNYCHIGTDILEYIAEKPNLKIGKLSPGQHIPVVEETRLFYDQPDYVLLLAWNLKDFIVPKIREKGFRGKIIIPIPSPRIL